jgi:hypothetical protein
MLRQPTAHHRSAPPPEPFTPEASHRRPRQPQTLTTPGTTDTIPINPPPRAVEPPPSSVLPPLDTVDAIAGWDTDSHHREEGDVSYWAGLHAMHFTDFSKMGQYAHQTFRMHFTRNWAKR